MILITLFMICANVSAHATIYVGFSDPETDDLAMAVITSGPIDTENRINSAEKEKGMVGWSGKGRVSELADKMIYKMMSESMSATEIEKVIEEKYPTQYYRLLFITPKGEIGSVVPKNGCPDLECGKREAANFVVIGGGLEDQVLEKTWDKLSLLETQREKPAACKMLEVLNHIVQIGGEKKSFTSAQIIIDSPKRDKLLRANSFKTVFKTSENKILQNLKDELISKGVNCSLL